MSQEEKESTRHGLYYVIPSSIMDDERLLPTDIVLYALLSGLADENSKCFPSDAYIAKRLHMKIDGAQKAVKRLAELGLIERHTHRCSTNPFRSFRLITVHKEFKKCLRNVPQYGPEDVLENSSQGDPGAVLQYGAVAYCSTAIESEVSIVSEERERVPQHPPSEVGVSLSSSFSNESKKIAQKLLDNLLAIHPGFKRPDICVWAEDIQEMIRKDCRAPKDVLDMVEFAALDVFWSTALDSPKVLRKKYDQIFLKMNKSQYRWKEKNKSIAKECEKSLRDHNIPICKEFFIGDSHITRIDTGEQLRMDKDPQIFESEMLKMFKLKRN